MDGLKQGQRGTATAVTSTGSLPVERPEADATVLLQRWRRGDAAALDTLMELLYGTLRSMAAARVPARGGDRTLRPTVLVNEALLRLLDSRAGVQDRQHFLALAALKMRGVVADHARAIGALKRGGDQLALTLSVLDHESPRNMTVQQDLFALDQALTQLEAQDPRAARALECMYFAGMDRVAIAEVLEVSVPTVDRDLRFARAWLNRRLGASA